MNNNKNLLDDVELDNVSGGVNIIRPNELALNTLNGLKGYSPKVGDEVCFLQEYTRNDVMAALNDHNRTLIKEIKSKTRQCKRFIINRIESSYVYDSSNNSYFVDNVFPRGVLECFCFV